MRVPLSDGAEAVFTDHDNGKTSGLPVVLLHGLTSNSTTGVPSSPDWQEGESSPLISAATVRLPDHRSRHNPTSAFLVSPKT